MKKALSVQKDKVVSIGPSPAVVAATRFFQKEKEQFLKSDGFVGLMVIKKAVEKVLPKVENKEGNVVITIPKVEFPLKFSANEKGFTISWK